MKKFKYKPINNEINIQIYKKKLLYANIFNLIQCPRV